jgi:hypothetical protein
MKQSSLPLLAFLLFFAASFPSANANLVIDPTFDSTITSDPNAATIEASINATIARIESDIANSTTVTITFQEGGGLGGSSTAYYIVPYTTYRSDLAAAATSADDAMALATLPAGPDNPVNGNADVNVGTSLARVLGIADYGGSDGTITLNTSIMNLSRTGPQNSGYYDIEAVAAHEIDEVLGIGGPGSALPTTNSSVGILDLFRYSAPGVRSFTSSSSATSYFSINGGTTNLVGFNQAGGGSDYSDWATGATPQVQDAFGSPGVDINVGSNEATALDVVGWNLTAQGLALESVPEPSTVYLLLGGLLALGLHRRLRKSA